MSSAFADCLPVLNLCYNVGTYDVQSVSISQIAGTMSLRVGCTFVMNALAEGCQLTVCRRGSDACINPQVSPDTPHMNLTDLQPGNYIISQVVEVEENFSLIVISDVLMFGELEATLLPFITTEPLPSSSTVGE